MQSSEARDLTHGTQREVGEKGAEEMEEELEVDEVELVVGVEEDEVAVVLVGG